jgi:hypothetical protein
LNLHWKPAWFLKDIFRDALAKAGFARAFHYSSFFLFSIIFISCASLSPVSLEREKSLPFEKIDTIEPQWQTIDTGLEYFHGKIHKPKLEFWALRIDLEEPSLRLMVKGGASNGSNTPPNHLQEVTLSTKVSSFVRDNGLIAGINAAPFWPVSGKEGEPRTNVGIVVNNGELIAPAHARYDALVIYTDGKAAIVSQAEIHSIENIECAIGGFFQVLKNNEPAERTLNSEVRHPRSAAGISASGKYLYMLVIDGRRTGSIGSTEKETALVLQALGSYDGINFDGGGSSALVIHFPDGKVRVVNTPIHNRIPGLERAVAGCIGIGR